MSATHQQPDELQAGTATRHNGITARLRALKVGRHIIVRPGEGSIRGLFVIAGRVGIKIATRTDGENLKVWRLE